MLVKLVKLAKKAKFQPNFIPRFYIVVLLSFWSPHIVYAAVETIDIPFSALQPGSDGKLIGDPLSQSITNLLQQELVKADIVFQGDGATQIFTVPAMNGGSCTASVETTAGNVNVLFFNSSSIKLTLQGIKDITLRILLNGNISLTTPALVRYGSNLFGECKEYARDSGSISANANFSVDLQLQVKLKPSYDSINEQILVDKYANLSSTAQFSQVDIDGDFGGLNVTGILIEAVEQQLIDNFVRQGNESITRIVTKSNYRLDGKDQNGQINAAYLPAFNEVSIFQLPPEIQNSDYAGPLLSYLGLPQVLFDTLDKKPGEILYIMLALEGDQRKEALAKLGSTLMCDAIIKKFALDLDNNPIYAKDAGQCTNADAYGLNMNEYFSDAQCTQEVAFQPGDPATFCDNYNGGSSKLTLGNAASWSAVKNQANDPLPQTKTRPWSTTLATQLDIGTLSKQLLINPYMKQVNYKTIDNISSGNGVCELEMRIYKPTIDATQLRPIMALHGGTWSGRGFSFFGLEASIPFLVDQGHIVFAPFYRLAGNSDGNPECNGAGWREILADIQDALIWVRKNGAALGAIDQPVKLFGQSAGAHLAVWLATEHPNQVGKVLALYPPLDTLDFFMDRNGEYEAFANFGRRALLQLYGTRAGNSEINISAINFDGIDAQSPPDSLASIFPDSVFNFSSITTDQLPPYIQYCAELLSIDPVGINLQTPSNELLSCIKQDFSDYILATSYYHKIIAKPVSIRVVQGTSDRLVPVQQVVNLCQILETQSINVNIDQLAGLTERQCGNKLSMQIIKDAGHMLDLGLCIGELCPAGAQSSSSRINTISALENSVKWLVKNPASSGTEQNTGSSAGSVNYWSLWFFVFYIIYRNKTPGTTATTSIKPLA